MRKIASMLLVLALLGACSDGSDERTSPVSGSGGAGGEDAETPDRPDATASGPRRDSGEATEPGDDDAAGEPASAAGDGSDDGDSLFNDGEGEDDNSSALHPAGGRYVYRQSGYERFCQAASCEQQPLPPRQPVDVKVTERGSERAVVVSEVRASDNRMVRTTTTFARRNAEVTDVYARFAYEGFSFENSYRPRPPVETLRFPLKQGDRWSGSWEDSTSGDYSVNVLGRDNVEVNGAALQAYKLSSVTNFRGEFTGSSKAVLWVDVATKTIVKTSGKLDLRSSFGRYITEFNNHLRAGPGYR